MATIIFNTTEESIDGDKKEAREEARTHGIPFDGQDLLDELEKELVGRRTTRKKNPLPTAKKPAGARRVATSAAT